MRVTAAITAAGQDAITAKWTALGGAAVVGAATSTVQDIGTSGIQYQTFLNGVIVYTDDFGAVLLSWSIFNKWLSLPGTVTGDGTDVFAFIGPPISDTTTTGAITQVDFQKGRVVSRGAESHAIYGAIYMRYAALASTLGFPLGEEDGEAGGGRFQAFENGEIHGRTDLGFFALNGPVLTRWSALGGPTGALGFPNADTAGVMNATGASIGRSGRFEKGVIYQSDTTGAWELSGDVLTAYEGSYGGPAGWLGFPIKGEGVAGSGDHYVDFQHGVLVNHQTGGDPTKFGIYEFGDLEVWYERVQGFGDDCVFGICGSQDVYTYLSITTQNGLILDKGRYPTNGNGGASFNVQQGIPLGAANSALVATVSVKAIDEDDGSDDDDLGTATATYSIDNLWGLFLPLEHHDNSMTATFNVRNHFPFDTKDFRGQLWWSFNNFTTSALSYDQYAAAFYDVEPQESLAHPFNRLWYKLAFKGAAETGNCFGMSLESIYAQVGRSSYTEPVHRYFTDTQGGQELNPMDATHAALINEINIKHGYQVGNSMIGWTMFMFFGGFTHDGQVAYDISDEANTNGDYPLISIFDSYMFGNGHSIRPYAWEPNVTCVRSTSPPCSHILIADPNLPTGFSSGDFIEVDNDDHYTYQNYSGGFWSGGRIFAMPFHVVSQEQFTPVGDLVELVEDAVTWAVSSTGKVNQVTDQAGRTMFRPGLVGPPTQWGDMVEDPSARVAQLAPLMIATDGPLPIQVFTGKGIKGATHAYDIVPTPGTPANTPYEASFTSGKMSSYFTIPGTPGVPDRVSAEKIGMSDRAIALTIPAGGQTKAVTWGVAGFEKHRWTELSQLTMAPAQTIRLRTANGGNRVTIENNGPATSAQVRISTGPGATPVDLGAMAIPTGMTTMNMQVPPQTTLTMGSVVTGKNGWVTAPVTVTLAAVDRSGVGIEAIEYGTDNVNWTIYTGPFSYANQGATTLYYRARDKAHNQEAAKSQTFKIDSRLPTVTATVATSAGVKLTYSAVDPAPGSGFASVHLLQGTTSPVATTTTVASGTLTLAGTCSAVELWAEDVAGNLSTHVKKGDSVGPVFTTSPQPISTTLCTTAAGLSLGAVKATDDCGALTLTNDAPAKFALGTTIVTWTARDSAGNVAVKTQTVTTELGDDSSCCPAGTKIILGTSNNDTLTGTSGSDCILGRGGQDTIKGLGGNDYLSGGAGDDNISGGDGNDSIFGGTGQDGLSGDAGDDLISGGDGVDRLTGGAGNDRLLGGQGGDNLCGDDGNDNLQGGADDDSLNGGSGNDFLDGGPNHDNVTGGGGTDQCVKDSGDKLSACTPVNP